MTLYIFWSEFYSADSRWSRRVSGKWIKNWKSLINWRWRSSICSELPPKWIIDDHLRRKTMNLLQTEWEVRWMEKKERKKSKNPFRVCEQVCSALCKKKNGKIGCGEEWGRMEEWRWVREHHHVSHAAEKWKKNNIGNCSPLFFFGKILFIRNPPPFISFLCLTCNGGEQENGCEANSFPFFRFPLFSPPCCSFFLYSVYFFFEISTNEKRNCRGGWKGKHSSKSAEWTEKNSSLLPFSIIFSFLCSLFSDFFDELNHFNEWQ